MKRTTVVPSPVLSMMTYKEQTVRRLAAAVHAQALTIEDALTRALDTTSAYELVELYRQQALDAVNYRQVSYISCGCHVKKGETS